MGVGGGVFCIWCMRSQISYKPPFYLVSLLSSVSSLPLIIYHAFDVQHPSLFVGVSIQVACLQFTMQPTAIEKKYFEGTRLQVLFVCCSRHHTRNNLTALLKSSVYRFAFRRKKRFFKKYPESDLRHRTKSDRKSDPSFYDPVTFRL